MKAMKFNHQRGELVLVWDDNESQSHERIFLTEIEGAIYPIQAVHSGYEKEFLNGEPFDIVNYRHMKPLNNKLSELKAKHREDVINAYNDAKSSIVSSNPDVAFRTAEQYYNETFKQ